MKLYAGQRVVVKLDDRTVKAVLINRAPITADGGLPDYKYTVYIDDAAEFLKVIPNVEEWRIKPLPWYRRIL